MKSFPFTIVEAVDKVFAIRAPVSERRSLVEAGTIQCECVMIVLPSEPSPFDSVPHIKYLYSLVHPHLTPHPSIISNNLINLKIEYRCRHNFTN